MTAGANSIKDPLVSVILPTYNRCQIIETSILSIFNQTYANIEIVVINDCSSDETAEVLNRIKQLDHRVRVFNNTKRMGLPASRNKGVSYSRGSLIYFSEDDLVLDSHCISTLIKTLNSLSNKYCQVAAVGPRLVTFPRRPPCQSNRVVAINPITKDIESNYELNLGAPVQVETLHSCSLIVRSAMLQVGGYETGLYKGSYAMEETDFYFRLRRKGYRLFFESQAIVYHYTGGLGGCILPSKSIQEFYNIKNFLFFSVRFYRLQTIRIFPMYMLRFFLRKWRVPKYSKN